MRRERKPTTLTILLLILLADTAFAAISGDDFIQLCATGNTHAIAIAINEGVNVNFMDHEGRTPLITAIQNNNSDAVFVLLKAGANTDIIDWEGKTALIRAVQYDNYRVVHYLLEAGASINIQDWEGKTALMWAVQHNNQIIVDSLLQAGADPGITNNEGHTARSLASLQNTSKSNMILMSLRAAEEKINGYKNAKTNISRNARANISQNSSSVSPPETGFVHLCSTGDVTAVGKQRLYRQYKTKNLILSKFYWMQE